LCYKFCRETADFRSFFGDSAFHKRSPAAGLRLSNRRLVDGQVMQNELLREQGLLRGFTEEQIAAFPANAEVGHESRADSYYCSGRNGGRVFGSQFRR